MIYIECSNGVAFVNTTKHNTIRTDHNFEQEIFMYNSPFIHEFVNTELDIHQYSEVIVMLAFVCVSVNNLASDTIEKLVFVCLSVCVCLFVRICVSTGLYHTSLTVGRLLSTNIQGIGPRS